MSPGISPYLGLIGVNELLGGPCRALGGVVGAEEQPLAGVAAQFQGLGVAPRVGTDDDLRQPQILGLPDDQWHFVVVLRCEQYFGVSVLDLDQLGAEVHVAGSEALERYHRT